MKFCVCIRLTWQRPDLQRATPMATAMPAIAMPALAVLESFECGLESIFARIRPREFLMGSWDGTGCISRFKSGCSGDVTEERLGNRLVDRKCRRVGVWLITADRIDGEVAGQVRLNIELACSGEWHVKCEGYCVEVTFVSLNWRTEVGKA